MYCPYCGFDQSSVLESRDAEEGVVTRRRRECVKCGKRFTTYERVGNIDLKIQKKDGSLQSFDPQKLIRGIKKACWKRSVTEEKIQSVVDEIEMMLLNRAKNIVSSKDVGRMAMNRLKKIDKIAYLRFASVYLDLESIADFEKLITDLSKGEKSGQKERKN
jgi:transcriptional repressor NrdR